MKHGKEKDAKRRKLEKKDASESGSNTFNKSDDKQRKKGFKSKDDTKFGAGKKPKANVDKSNDSKNTINKNKLKKSKPTKKSKGKKKSHRNKNK